MDTKTYNSDVLTASKTLLYNITDEQMFTNPYLIYEYLIHGINWNGFY